MKKNTQKPAQSMKKPPSAKMPKMPFKKGGKVKC